MQAKGPITMAAANLPVSVTGNGPQFIRVVTGKISPENKTVLRLGLECEKENGQEIGLQKDIISPAKR